jgi:hypothetical protein
MQADVPETALPSTPLPLRRRRRWWRWVFALLVLLAILIAVLPYVITSGPVVQRALAHLRPHLGADLQVQAVKLGWLSGFSLRGVSLGQPAGYPREPAFTLRRMDIDASLWGFLFGTPTLRVEIEAPRFRIYRRQGEQVNWTEIVVREQVVRERVGTPPPPAPRPSQPIGWPNLAVDIALRDGEIEVYEEGADGYRLVEAVRKLTFTAKTTGSAPPLEILLDAELERAGGKPGRIAMRASVDPRDTQPLRAANLEANAFSLDKYAPVLAAFGVPLDRTDGVLEGSLSALATGSHTMVVSGELTLSDVHLAGPALAPRAIVGTRFVLRPNCTLDLIENRADAENLVIDLEFLRVDGLPSRAMANCCRPPAGCRTWA